VLATAAAPPNHPEILAAQDAGIRLLRREDLWRIWSQQRTIIAVAGTHGKTTTTAMLAWVFAQAGQQPGFLIGGDSFNLGTNARWGDPAAPLIIEADEYSRAFLALTASVAVITNVEWDHPDIYPTAQEYDEAFAAFVIEAEGPIITCGDHDTSVVAGAAQQVDLPLLRYGLAPANDYRALLEPPAENQDVNSTTFHLQRPKGLSYIVYDDNTALDSSQYQLGMPGLHNVRNALAAIVVADIFGLPAAQVAAALRDFRGTARRFEQRGEAEGVLVIDDYAHHPTEVRATLAAARRRYPRRRIVAYLQPHTYSRTRALLEQWPQAFDDADIVLVGAIYAAREIDHEGAHKDLALQLVECIAACHQAVSYVGELEAAATAALRTLHQDDVLLTMGAGDGCQVGDMVLAGLQAGHLDGGAYDCSDDEPDAPGQGEP
jgi:UDP-N-acetylmuramate--alanine ligase